MRPILQASLISFTAALALSACKPAADAPAPTAAEPAAPTSAPAGTAMPTAWPASLVVIGDGFPNAGDACRRIGESEATSNYLDDSAALVGCLSADDAAKLGGKVVATVEGVTLVSVPDRPDLQAEGSGETDAKVPGTPYHATAQIRCSGYKGAPAGMCEAGVVRDTDTGSYVDVRLPDGAQRTILFKPDDSFLGFSTAQADGTAAMQSGSTREGDTTIATLGTERYEIPDVLVTGD